MLHLGLSLPAAATDGAGDREFVAGLVAEPSLQRPACVSDVLWEDYRAGRHGAVLPGLLMLEGRCAMDPNYNALLAEISLGRSDFSQASLALERLVLLQPENAGAWLDLAVTSLKLRDELTARRALEQVDRNFAPPPGIRLLVDKLRAQLDELHTPPPSPFRIRGAVLYGQDSNANGGLAARSLTLTPGSIQLDLPVDAAFRARGSPLWLMSAELVGRNGVAGEYLDWRMALAEKRYADVAEFDTRDVTLAASWQHPLSAGSHGHVLGEWRRLDMGGRPLVEVPRLRLGLDLPAPASMDACRLGVAADHEWRRYRPDLKRYDGRLLWGEASVRCPWGGGALTAIAKVGADLGPGDRPGGDTRRQELATFWHGAVRQRGEVMVGAFAAWAKDQSGYSPLIRSNARRETQRLTMHAELSWPLVDAWRWVAVAERTHQSSNLGLFGLDQAIFMLGIRYGG